MRFYLRILAKNFFLTLSGSRSEAWQQNLIEKGGIMRHQRSVKGKGKQLET